MKIDDNKMIYNTNEHKAEDFISKAAFKLEFNENEVKVIYSLN